MLVQNVKNVVGVAVLIASLLLNGSVIHAAQAPIDINHANISLVYQAGVTPIDGLIVKCGTSTLTYNRLTQFPAGTTLFPVAKVIGGNGNWFCVIVDFVQTASGPLEGKGSNEINFFAAVAPSGIMTISIIP